ncbi:OmpA family protein [Erwinia persicina]|uniref:OmpA family protein n=1 Tax=Erwinia persicina TaxID=55211 RepID=UPI00177B3279|nr:OmpA family protein [Erwinia persicina]MBD8162452.1 OmpA family protein [Erwinia persicina]MBD8214904.1 OmpA family protein [Erwinia persicina]
MKILRVMAGVLLALVLAGCQTAPQGKFTAEQISAMRAQGFTEVPEGWMLGISEKILFGKNKAELTPESVATVQRMAKTLSASGLRHARLDGHTDNYGDEKYNEALSLKRANVVADAWASGAGVTRSNITTRGLGARDPVQSNKTSQGRAENRRVAVVISAP